MMIKNKTRLFVYIICTPHMFQVLLCSDRFRINGQKHKSACQYKATSDKMNFMCVRDDTRAQLLSARETPLLNMLHVKQSPSLIHFVHLRLQGPHESNSITVDTPHTHRFTQLAAPPHFFNHTSIQATPSTHTQLPLPRVHNDETLQL